MRKAWLLAGILLALGAGAARAADVKFGGLIFGQYAHWLSKRNSSAADARGRSAFSVSRIYVNAEAKFSDKLKGKVVLEGKTDEATKNLVFLKNAFGEYSFCDHAGMTFGVIGTPWIGFEEGIWGRRFVQKVQLDQEGLLSSADGGVGLIGKLPKGYGSYHMVYVNGEGYNKDELAAGNGRAKDYMTRLTIVPLPEQINGVDLSGFNVHTFLQQGHIQSGEARRRDRYVFGASYKHALGYLMYSYYTGAQGDGTLNRKIDGWSMHGSVNLPRDFSLFARYDRNGKAGNGETAASIRSESWNRGIVGVDYKLADGARVALSDQWLTPVKPEAVGTITNKANENQLLAQLELKF